MEGAAGSGDALVLLILWISNTAESLAHCPGIVSLEQPLVSSRKQQGVLENAAITMGQWEGAGAGHGPHVEGT